MRFSYKASFFDGGFINVLRFNSVSELFPACVDAHEQYEKH